MAKDSHIEWTHHTHNEWEGCDEESPACAHCYARTRNARFGGGIAVNWGKDAPRRLTSEANRNQPRKWNKQATLRGTSLTHAEAQKVYGASLPECESHEWDNRTTEDNNQWMKNHGVDPFERPRVFSASLSDWLDEQVPLEWLAGLLTTIYETPNLDWLLLSKRVRLWRSRLQALLDAGLGPVEMIRNWLNGIPPENVWVGATVENQKFADIRIPILVKIPAKVRFLSCEPLLGPIEFSNVSGRSDWKEVLGLPALSGIHWIICGFESGSKARPGHPNWARSLRDQCVAVGVAFLMKQWGEWAPGMTDEIRGARSIMMSSDGTICESEDSETIWEFCHDHPNVVPLYHAGKKKTGRLLDGREWNEFPEVTR